MRLGGNKGKKYIRKCKIDSVYAARAEDFNLWFSQNIKEIEEYFTIRYMFDYDVFSDCFLAIYENILFSGIEIKNYASHFRSSYYRRLGDSKEMQNRYCELLPNYDKSDIDNNFFDEIEVKAKELESDIFGYIYSKYDVRDFELFKMYMSLKPAVNYDTLAQITKLKAHNIQRTISKIKKDIRDNKDFANRRKEIL